MNSNDESLGAYEILTPSLFRGVSQSTLISENQSGKSNDHLMPELRICNERCS